VPILGNEFLAQAKTFLRYDVLRPQKKKNGSEQNPKVIPMVQK